MERVQQRESVAILLPLLPSQWMSDDALFKATWQYRRVEAVEGVLTAASPPLPLLGPNTIYFFPPLSLHRFFCPLLLSHLFPSLQGEHCLQHPGSACFRLCAKAHAKKNPDNLAGLEPQREQSPPPPRGEKRGCNDKSLSCDPRLGPRVGLMRRQLSSPVRWASFTPLLLPSPVCYSCSYCHSLVCVERRYTGDSR